MVFDCPTCGEVHDLAELSFGTEAPEQWYLLTDEERAESHLSADQCVITAEGKRSFYLRAGLEIPIAGSEEVFLWGVWSSLSESSFDEVHERWTDSARSECGPHLGWLSTVIPGYESMFQKVRVHQRPPGQRPLIEVLEGQGELALHQQEGIAALDLVKRVVSLLHGG